MRKTSGGWHSNSSGYDLSLTVYGADIPLVRCRLDDEEPQLSYTWSVTLKFDHQVDISQDVTDPIVGMQYLLALASTSNTTTIVSFDNQVQTAYLGKTKG